MTQGPRKPGSQVAPRERPLFTDGRTATTHSKIPLHQATAGQLYRVRDRNWTVIWGENLSHHDATKLKDQIVGAGKSRTARVEPMTVEPPAGLQPPEPLPVAPPPPAVNPPAAKVTFAFEDGGIVAREIQPAPAAKVTFELEDVTGKEVVVPCAGVITKIPPEFQLLINGSWAAVPAQVQEGDIAVARPMDPEIVANHAAVLAAMAPVAAAAQARARVIPKDTTVTAPAPRNPNPPRDKTVSREPVLVRLAPPYAGEPDPPESPQKVAELGGDPITDDATLTDADLTDLVPDIGGGPNDADIEHARRVRDHAQPGPVQPLVDFDGRPYVPR